MAIGTAASVSNMSAILKKIWPQDAVSELYFDEAPLLAMLPKKTDWVGSTMEVVLQYGQGGGRSSSFTNAKANKTNPKTAKMSVELSDNYCLWSVDHKLIATTKNDRGALARALEQNTKSAMKKFKRSMCWMIYGNGGSAIGQVDTSTTLGSTTLKFRSSRSLRNVDIDDILCFSSDDGTGGAGVRTGTLRVTAVDPENRTVTVDANINSGITSPSTSDYVFHQGDYAACFYGLEAYVPSTAPSTTLWGMTRTTSKRRLGGIRVGGKGLLIQEAIKKALKVSKDEGASISHLFMSTDDFLNLELSLGSAVRYVGEKVAGVGFTGIQFVTGGSKPLKVFMDPDCPANVIWGLQLDTRTKHTVGEFPDFLTLPGGDRFHQEESTNSFEGRVGGYGQLYTDAPGYNFRLDMTAA